MGASDPSSGTATVHEVIRGFGHLVKNGWKPLRTVVFASWDAEEVCIMACSFGRSGADIGTQYGLVGSTEFTEDFAEWLSTNVVAYINLGECFYFHRHIPT